MRLWWRWFGRTPSPKPEGLARYYVPVKMNGLKGISEVVDALDRTVALVVEAESEQDANRHVKALLGATGVVHD